MTIIVVMIFGAPGVEYPEKWDFEFNLLFLIAKVIFFTKSLIPMPEMSRYFLLSTRIRLSPKIKARCHATILLR